VINFYYGKRSYGVRLEGFPTTCVIYHDSLLRMYLVLNVSLYGVEEEEEGKHACASAGYLRPSILLCACFYLLSQSSSQSCWPATEHHSQSGIERQLRCKQFQTEPQSYRRFARKTRNERQAQAPKPRSRSKQKGEDQG